jgi:hypothetical protein
MGELDKFEPVGAGRVVGGNFCARCVVRERTHGSLLVLSALLSAWLTVHMMFAFRCKVHAFATAAE